jgi:hypothetical protein
MLIEVVMGVSSEHPFFQELRNGNSTVLSPNRGSCARLVAKSERQLGYRDPFRRLRRNQAGSAHLYI